ncbi:hypothetical protein ACEI25_004304 [Photobacterium damselae]
MKKPYSTKQLRSHPDQISFCDTLQLPLGHGGKREGAGRKKGEATTTIRVPVACLSDIHKLLDKYKAEVQAQKEKKASQKSKTCRIPGNKKC